MAPRICSSRHHCTRGHFYYTNSCRSRRLVVGFREKQVTERVSECIDLEQLLHWELTGCRIPIPATGSSPLSRNQGTNRHKNTKAHDDELHLPHALRQEAEGLGSEDLDSIVSERLTLQDAFFLRFGSFSIRLRGGSVAGMQLRVRFVPAALLAMLRTVLALRCVSADLSSLCY
jgi:hypothetical protein